MKRPHVILPDALDRAQILVRDRAAAETRVQFLSGHRGSRDSDVDADGARRTHCVGGITDQKQAIACPIVDQANDAFERKEWREILQPVGEVREDRIELPDTASHSRHSILAPAFPFARGKCDPGLNMMRVLGKNQTPDLLAKRDIEGAVPTFRLRYRKPHEVEIMILVLGLEPPIFATAE